MPISNDEYLKLKKKYNTQKKNFDMINNISNILKRYYKSNVKKKTS